LGSSSFTYTGSLIFQGQDFLSPMNTDMNFSGNYFGGSVPALTGNFLGNWAGRNYSGKAQLQSGRLYFSLNGPDMPVIRYRQSQYLVPLQAGAWYSAKADESLYDNVCAHTHPSTLENKLALYRTIKSLKLMPSPWINFWSRIFNSRATHVSATVSGDQLGRLWDAVQKAAPPGCGDPNTLGLSSADLKLVSTRVDLYASADDLDSLAITLTDKTLGATATINLLTSNYGHATPLSAPPPATNLNAVYAGFSLK
jgi:hypothetical protein